MVFQPVTSASWSNGGNAAAAAQNITVDMIYHLILRGMEKEFTFPPDARQH